MAGPDRPRPASARVKEPIMSELIVVGTDGSPQAGRAVRWAADEAARRGLALRIVHVVGRHARWPSPHPMPGVFDSLVDGGRRILAEAEETALRQRPGLPLTTLLVQAESPSAGLREQAADAAEVVVGHRGLGGFTGLVLGSTGLHVAGHLPVPVVVVRGGGPHGAARAGGTATGGGTSRSQHGALGAHGEHSALGEHGEHGEHGAHGAPGGHGEVVAGVDLGEDATLVLDRALAAAAARGARLRVVHAWRPAPAVLNEGFMIDMAEVEVDYRDHLATIVTPWRERHPETEIVQDVLCDHPVHALAELSHKADLLVVGHHTRGGLRLGSICHGVIHHATCPVAVVPPPAR